MKTLTGLLHSWVPGHGLWATLLEVGLFAALIMAVLGIVLIGEDELEGSARWSWTAIVLLVPILGTVGYLVRRRDDDAT